MFGSQVTQHKGHTYDVHKSLTAKSFPGRTFFEGFPQNSVSGIVIDDIVILANTSAMLNGFALGAVDNASSAMSNQRFFDGFLGLGFPDSTHSNSNRIEPRLIASLISSLIFIKDHF